MKNNAVKIYALALRAYPLPFIKQLMYSWFDVRDTIVAYALILRVTV